MGKGVSFLNVLIDVLYHQEFSFGGEKLLRIPNLVTSRHLRVQPILKSREK